jgi:hypothetical protein
MEPCMYTTWILMKGETVHSSNSIGLYFICETSYDLKTTHIFNMPFTLFNTK